jgi:glycosyltransferase involved in cell wall biosynthesis
MLSIILPNFNEPQAYETMRDVYKLYPAAQVLLSSDVAGRGKGWAVKKGLFASLGDVVVFLDSDGDIEPRMIARLLPFLDDYDIVVGTKTLDGMRLHRKIITLLSRIYIKIMFWLDIDTQGGIKAMHKSAIEPWVTSGFLFDVEFLYRAKQNKMKIVEVPIKAHITKSKSAKVLLDALIDSLQIWWRVRWK